MPTIPAYVSQVVPPTPAEALLAQESSRLLSSLTALKPENPLSFRIASEGDPGKTITIPAVAFQLLKDILAQMAKGNAVTLVPIHAELTTQEAADILNVSRPFLIKLLSEGAIPFHLVGTHRRIRCEHLMAYKKEAADNQLKALEELAAQAQELDMGY